ncbi:MAG: prolyl oligopeptidase family serine peptidase [Ewingella americana]|jgi:oligopeptidase B|uniref:S9 family peptidase n=1 Tax=Ewingella americana TaxID=41202 RepID=UPI00242EBCA5|nr:prolyl oligopeptidase family serine peptidase [Ewingella americana]MCI1678981.1 prolyl oligopeptidase family serine peptidase [Ewingella americana]MCI1852375.1 prolyl oligopeptidase family serine peptidase [Ewingella americana]MCI1862777.1 prolyl oligopeptidase family serine peptidase [Ewingella americana]MCI2141825.1 prolyl oligopeptidase family serine peptidase [Ewingella americana]MCI2164965.1 prolyl oligopeptidase family serine peptidase [Ewingella americana]
MTTPPKAEKRPKTLSIHGEDRVDNYYWLRDDDRANSDVLSYLQAENAYTEQALLPHQALRETLYQEMVARIAQQDHSVPYVKHGYRYQTRYEPGNEYAIYLRQPAAESEQWQTLIDGNERASDSEFYTLGGLDISPDNKLMAVSEDFLSRRQYDIRIKNLQDESWNDDLLKNTAGSEWANDSQTLYYVRKHKKTLLPYQVYRHTVGTDPKNDQLVYEEKDDTFYVGLDKTTSDQYVIIHLDSTTTSEVLLLDANDPQAKPQVFVPRRKDHEYGLDHYQGHFYIRSNRDIAAPKDGKNFGLYKSADNNEAGWQTLIAPREAVMLEGFSLFRDWLVVEEREQGLTNLRQIHWTSGEEKSLNFDDPTYVTWLAYNPDPDTSLLRYGYSSMTTPSSLFELDLDTGERALLKQQEVKDFDAANYRSERVWVTARDGVKVPVSLVYRRDTFKPNSNPLLVYGYGSYGSSMDPAFSGSRLSLLDRGFVFALAHIRGGAELGQQWYDNGKLLNKMNTFHDFIDVTKELVAEGYGEAQQVYAMGGSAGGLLMGAVINQAPELYRGIVAQVPFVDVVTTMLDESIPLTTGEYDEWGNPNDKTYYDYILQYSPYDQVKAQDYPNMLVTTGLHDSQVQYWEPAKWVAKLRELKTDDNQLLMYTDMDSGHGGKSGRFKAYEDIALEYAFVLSLAGKS